MNERMRDKICTSLVTATPGILCCCTWHESENCHNVYVSTHMKREPDFVSYVMTYCMLNVWSYFSMTVCDYRWQEWPWPFTFWTNIILQQQEQQNLNFQLKMSEIRNLIYVATSEWLIDACEENHSLISNAFQSC